MPEHFSENADVVFVFYIFHASTVAIQLKAAATSVHDQLTMKTKNLMMRK